MGGGQGSLMPHTGAAPLSARTLESAASIHSWKPDQPCVPASAKDQVSSPRSPPDRLRSPTEIPREYRCRSQAASHREPPTRKEITPAPDSVRKVLASAVSVYLRLTELEHTSHSSFFIVRQPNSNGKCSAIQELLPTRVSSATLGGVGWNKIAIFGSCPPNKKSPRTQPARPEAHFCDSPTANF